MTGYEDTILDRQALRELREDLEDAFEGFVQRFLGNAREALALMEAALHRGEAEDVGRQAHALKGTAGYLGAIRLSARLDDLQKLAKEGEADPMTDVLAATCAEFEALEIQLLDAMD